MIKINWLFLGKTLAYEFDYLLRRFRLVQALILFSSLVIATIISLGDTQSFFIGENSPIPNSWTIFKDKRLVNIMSTGIIVASYFLPWLLGFLESTKESKDLSNAVEENLVPVIGSDLKKLQRVIRQKFQLAEDVRVSLFIPVRQRLFRWSLQMVCRTDNIPERELLAKFQLDEGVIGYTFLKNKKHCIEFVNVSNSNSQIANYKPLAEDNKTLIDRSIKAVLVVAAFQEGSVVGLLAIDTNNEQNIPKMENQLLHDAALDWIIARSKAVRLLWRMKNNV